MCNIKNANFKKTDFIALHQELQNTTKKSKIRLTENLTGSFKSYLFRKTLLVPLQYSLKHFKRYLKIK